MNARVSRRKFIQASTLAPLSMAGALNLLLAACSSASPAASVSGSPAQAASPATSTGASGAGSAASARAGGVKLPTHVPVQAVKPDLPGTDTIPDGFLTYPPAPFKSVAEVPGSGGDLNWMTYTIVPNAALPDNPAWQEVNKQVNANIKFSLTPFADYLVRMNSVLAGGDLPDAIFLQGLIPDQAQMLQANFADLTPYLSGDAVKAYPNLANLPTQSWKSTLFNGGIYAVPTAYMRFFWMLWARQEMLDKIGAPLPATADDFKKVLQQLTSPSAGVWGIGAEQNTAYSLYTGLHVSMFGAPNQWAESGGKFTRTWETEQFKAAVGYARDLYAAGVYHPTYYSNILAKRADFQAGKFAFDFDGMTTDLWNIAKQLIPATKLRQPVPPPGDGSKGHYWYGSGAFGITAIKKASPDRIKEILRIMDYLAAPFGSQEYLLLHYGIKGTDYDFDANGNPVLTKKGIADTMPWGAGTVTVPNPPQVLYNPTDPQFVSVIQGDQKPMDQVGVGDPSIGLFSRTDAAKRAVLNQAIIDGLTGIIKGTDPLTKFDQLVADWRKNGGDQTRSEYEQAFAAASS